mmetsp:Transcript_94/g.290  ORF Transcript_94/g.290 Transcript_94/m.290 type:complete len:401 (+) Transcript_94:21-1223(+)
MTLWPVSMWSQPRYGFSCWLPIVCCAILLTLEFPTTEASPSDRSYCRPQNCYEYLNVTRNSTKGEVKKAYYKLSLEFHPDKVPTEQRENASKIFVNIANAYEILYNETARTYYDEWLDAGGIFEDDTIFSDRWGFHQPRDVQATPGAMFGVLIVCGIPLLIPFCAGGGGKGKKSRWKRFTIASKMIKDHMFPPKKEEKPEPIKKKEPKPPRAARSNAPSRSNAVAKLVAPVAPVVAPAPVEAPPVQYNTGDWTREEDGLLVQAAVKYPGGTSERWRKISQFVGTRSEKDVLARTKALKTKPVGVISSPSAEGDSAPSTPQPADVPLADKPAASVSPVKPGQPAAEWPAADQAALEAALKEHPVSDPDRWENIARSVGRTKRECVERYKHLAALIRSQQPA